MGWFSSAFQIGGILSSTIFSFYLEKTNDYNTCFKVSTILAILTSIVFPLMVQNRASFMVMFIIFVLLGLMTLSYFSLGIGYACDVLYPFSPAVITGSFGTLGGIMSFLLVNFP